MANEVRVALELTGEQRVKRGLEVVEKQAEKTGDAIEDMGDQATVAGKSGEKAGDKLKDASKDVSHLKKQVDDLTKSYEELIKKFDQTGDESLKKDIRSERRKLNEAKRLLKDITPEPAAVKEVGTSIGTQLMESIGTATEAGGPYLAGVIAGAAALAVPGLAATISGAILGGVGVGGIIGGVALAAQDPQVVRLAAQVADTLQGEFTDAAEPFVQPLLKSLEKIGTTKWADKLAPSMDKLSDHVEPLTDGLIELVDNVIPGLTDAAEAAGPSLDVLAAGLPDIGAALGDFFSTIAENPEAAAHALELLIGTITEVIETAGFLIAGFSESYEKAYSLAEGIGVVTEETQRLGWKAGETKGQLSGMGMAADDAAAEVAGLDDAIRKLISDTFGLEAAQDEVANTFARLKEQIKQQNEEHVKGAGSLQGNTQAARDNREVMRTLEEQYVTLLLKYADAGKSTAGLAEQFKRQAVQVGLNSKEVERYSGVLAHLPREIEVDIWLRTHGARAMNAVLAGVNSVDGARASGGPVSAGGAYIVGENGPELLQMGSANGHVYNAGQTASVMGASGGPASGPLQIELIHRWEGPGGAAGDIGEALAKWIRTDVKVRGGGSVNRAYDENT